MKLLNWLGLYTKAQYDRLKEESKVNLCSCNHQLTKSRNEVDFLKHEMKKQPYEFDYILSLYNELQLNSLTYKIINLCRNDPNRRHLLERWQKRADDAKSTIIE